MLGLLKHTGSAPSRGAIPATLLAALGLWAVIGICVEPSRAEVPVSTDRATVQLAQAAPSAGTSVSETDAIDAVVSGYYESFGRDSAAASALYGEPTLVITPNQIVLLSTRTDVEAFFDKVVAGLKRGGFSHSTLSDRRIKLLTSTTALCGGVAIRMKTDGTEMQRAGFTYLLQKSSVRWRIHEIIATDFDKLISAD
ncbi:hypothetical protein [Bradyrhizobium sp. LTSP885]|uniref:DUF6841 family protein n=1 Tax=Bradyrhizobium sp. LTSP885 TaxID=1619232 RepID=UPI0005CA9E5B|nr:hypothetical protein [Bradyrhizobium sp. LTSP885]